MQSADKTTIKAKVMHVYVSTTVLANVSSFYAIKHTYLGYRMRPALVVSRCQLLFY